MSEKTNISVELPEKLVDRISNILEDDSYLEMFVLYATMAQCARVEKELRQVEEFPELDENLEKLIEELKS